MKRSTEAVGIINRYFVIDLTSLVPIVVESTEQMEVDIKMFCLNV